MILLLNTSTPTCELALVVDGNKHSVTWESGRELAKGLLGFLQTEMEKLDKSWDDIEGLGIYKGPGSFTGLRIGVTVFNTLADARSLPIVGTTGESWQEDAARRLQANENDEIVIPEYGGEANITQPRK